MGRSFLKRSKHYQGKPGQTDNVQDNGGSGYACWLSGLGEFAPASYAEDQANDCKEKVDVRQKY